MTEIFCSVCGDENPKLVCESCLPTCATCDRGKRLKETYCSECIDINMGGLDVSVELAELRKRIAKLEEKDE